jgi:hypothetical protein
MTNEIRNPSTPIAIEHVEVLSFRRLERTGNVIGFAEIKIRGITIRDVKLVSSKSGELFLGMPSREYVGKDGAKKYQNIVELDRELKDAALQAVLASTSAAPAPAVEKTNALTQITERKEANDVELPF